MKIITIFSSKALPRLVLILLIGSILLACSFKMNTEKKEESAGHPNVLIVLIDDLGFHDLSSTGSKIYETPRVDQFAKEAYTFANAYANYPRCLPSRYGLITASYPVKEFNGDLTTVPEESNFIKQFQKAGYESFFVGKWHIGDSEKTSPKSFGFDHSYAANGAGGVASHFYPYNTQKIVAPIGEVPPIPDVEADGKEGDYLADAMTDRMIRFVTDRDSGKPFFAVLSTYAVHTPFEAKQEDIDRNQLQISQFDYRSMPEYVPEANGETKMRQDNAIYAGMVENMDWNVGRLLDALHSSGLDDNTIVVFTSDHGGLSNRGPGKRPLATTNFPLRAGKGHLYEGGIRVPLMIRWPDHVAVKEDEGSIVLLMDLMPTLLDLAVDGNLQNVDGQSFEDVMQGKKEWSDRTVYFYEKMARPQMTGDFPGVAVRAGHYKLIHYFDKDGYELYDLSNDISETNNLITNEPAIAAKMKAYLSLWMEEHHLNQN